MWGGVRDKIAKAAAVRGGPLLGVTTFRRSLYVRLPDLDFPVPVANPKRQPRGS